MSILVIPNAFKGSLTSKEAGTIIKEEIHSVNPRLEIDMFPFSDGGNDFLDSISYIYPKSTKISCKVHGPDQNQMVPSCFLIHDGIAYIESAKACGILLSKEKNPFKATSFGLGELIEKALDYPIKEIKIGLGGSATNDGGTGMLAALGVKFYLGNNESFIPTGGSLDQISRIDFTSIDKRLSDIRITVLSDVENPLLGANGASYVFARQKGCSLDDIPNLEIGMNHFAKKCKASFKKDFSNQQGSGAAGGIGFSLLLLGATMESGADFLLYTQPIKSAIERSTTIITGEGHLDSQTFNGKGIDRIMNAAKGKNIILIAGKADPDIAKIAKEKGAYAIYSLSNDSVSTEDMLLNAPSNMRKTIDKMIEEIFRILLM